MIVTQYYLDCLSQASYLIADEHSRQAVIVDPRRDVEEYLADLAERGLTLIGVINTHFHADFVSGHLELAGQTGAWIGYGQAAGAEFGFRPLADGERISLGEVTLQIMATPGHTPESVSVLVFERAGDEVAHAVLTGDTLFIGDVGRPDLLASIGVTAEDLGAMLHDSVQNKLMGLPDEVRVFPAHGAGSACGKNLSTERWSTIGEQRRFNYACQPMSRERFVRLVTEGQPAAPGYFAYNATLNRRQRDLRAPLTTVPALSAAQFEAALAAGARVLDARDPADFTAGHLRGSVNVGAGGRLAETAGMVFEPGDRILILAPAGAEQEVATRLARIGYDDVAGYLADPPGYLAAHPDRVGPASRLTVRQLVAARQDRDVQLVDVRNTGELESGRIAGAVNIPLAQLASRSSELDRARPVVVHCAGGYRSSVAASLLRYQGFTDVSDLSGGYGAWEQEHATV